VEGAAITLYTDTGTRRARTDRGGEFSVTDLSPGPAHLQVHAAGFAPFSTAIVIPDSGGRRPHALARIELVAEGVVEGLVVDPRGDPVAGARVAKDHAPTWLLVGSNPEGVAVTDGQGHFSLRGLPAGATRLEAYSPDLGRGRVDVSVEAGRSTEDVRIALASEDEAPTQLATTGGVAVTLGETAPPVEVMVVSVVEGSEAERAGLEPGDRLVAVDGVPVADMKGARKALGGPVGDDALLAVRRGGADRTVRVAREPIRR
jgi:membrane-associated protease RseP (regulator of RpoE activity)